MDLSEFMNIILGGGLVGTVATIGSLRATVRKAKAEAMKAEAGAEAMRIDNAEHATRILMENIVKPLKDEFCETKKELARNTREMARLRKASLRYFLLVDSIGAETSEYFIYFLIALSVAGLDFLVK